jgi:four helix bundle protein
LDWLIVEFTDELQIRRKFAVANQLLRSGTGIGASIWEAQNAESKRDFIHKLKIAAKGRRRNGILVIALQAFEKLS